MTVWPLQSDDKLAVLIVAFAIVVCIATAIQSPKSAEFQDVQVPEIIVPASAARSFQEMLLLSTSNIDSGITKRSRTRQSRTLGQLFAPEKALKIVVEGYGAESGWTPESVRVGIESFFTAPIWEATSFSTPWWSEPTIWSVFAKVKFKSGKHGTLLFDGVHGYYKDPNADPWFFVTLPRS
jgi:hypothetical protein